MGSASVPACAGTHIVCIFVEHPNFDLMRTDAGREHNPLCMPCIVCTEGCAPQQHQPAQVEYKGSDAVSGLGACVVAVLNLGGGGREGVLEVGD